MCRGEATGKDGNDMGLMDRVRGLLKGREAQVKSGIDKASNVAEKRLPKQAAKIGQAAGKAKDAVDKVARYDCSSRKP
ncbi:hypothetical protein BH24ACT6_BH24ACT6_15940 [soil metagenome]